MADGRKNNGNKGHSTKSTGVDKRRNDYKDVLNDALTESELKSVIRMLFDKSITGKDVNAGRILLEHYLGKPKQTIDNNNTNYNIIWNEEKTYE